MTDAYRNPVVAAQSSVAAMQDGVAATSAPTHLDDCAAEARNEKRYLDILNPLLSEAWEKDTMETFVDVLTWTLARVIARYDSACVTGDVLRRIGSYTLRIGETVAAADESDAAKRDGRIPH